MSEWPGVGPARYENRIGDSRGAKGWDKLRKTCRLTHSRFWLELKSQADFLVRIEHAGDIPRPTPRRYWRVALKQSLGLSRPDGLR